MHEQVLMKYYIKYLKDRLLHYGIDEQKEKVVNKIYYDRADRLAASGLKISKDDFYKLVI